MLLRLQHCAVGRQQPAPGVQGVDARPSCRMSTCDPPRPRTGSGTLPRTVTHRTSVLSLCPRHSLRFCCLIFSMSTAGSWDSNSCFVASRLHWVSSVSCCAISTSFYVSCTSLLNSKQILGLLFDYRYNALKLFIRFLCHLLFKLLCQTLWQ